MNTWDKLSMAERAEVMRLAVENGIYDLGTIRDGYNEFAKGGRIHIKPENRGKFTALKKRTGHSATWFKEHGTPAQKKMAVFALNARKWKHGFGGNLFSGEEEGSQKMITTGGAGYITPTSNTAIQAFKNKLPNLSKNIMLYIQDISSGDLQNPFNYINRDDTGGTAQDYFLLPKNLQKEQFLKAGYIEGKKGDYGLVKKAVGNRDLPVYQTAPDVIDRKDLIVLGNSGYYLANNPLEHAGSHPHANYTDGHGNFYQKAWDLNDYGGEGGSTAGFAGKLLDLIGNPTVVTTGFQKIEEHPWSVKTRRAVADVLKQDMAKKGLVPTEIDDKIQWTLPEIVITGKKRAYGDKIKKR